MDINSQMAHNHLQISSKKCKKTTLSLSVLSCLATMLNVTVMSSAQAETVLADTQVNTQTRSVVTDTNAQLEDALIALKLKQAVEQGIIDASVLEDYQRETLNANANSSQPTDIKAMTSSTTVDNGIGDNVSDNTLYSSIYNDADSFDEQFAQFDVVSVDDADNGLQAEVMSPEQIEAELANLQDDAFADDALNQDVSTLDNPDTPFGYDDDIDSFTVPTDIPTRPASLDTSIKNLSSIDSSANSSTVSPDVVSESWLSKPMLTNNQQPQQSLADIVSSTTKKPMQSAIEDSSTDTISETVLATDEDVETLNPDEYLPTYQTEQNTLNDKVNGDPINPVDAKASAVTASSDSARNGNDEGFFKRLYNNVFNDGYAGFAKLNATVYRQDGTDAEGNPVLIKADKNVQPIQNIKEAVEEITVESISDFTVALPKLRSEALAAAKAVGYYDVQLRFVKQSDNEVDVIIEKLGEPVFVTARVVDIRGEGADLPEFVNIKDIAPPRVGDVFNHGTYKQTIAAVEQQKSRFGFFEGEWLNRSADIILPDNKAEVDLIYNTGTRYEFGEVVFFTLDRETGELTTDPNKLPLRPELLHQLYDFELGEAFYRPAVTTLTNDLAATRYFNTINVELIEPDVQSLQPTSNGLADESGNGELSFSAEAKQEPELENVNAVDDVFESEDNQELTVEDAKLAPVDFSVDSETKDKLQAIKQKANRLSALPDDRVLGKAEDESTSVLGEITNAISDVAQIILPDDVDPFASPDALPEDFEPPQLANKQTPQQVAQTKKVPLYVFVESENPRDAQFGLGWGTDTGVRAVAKLDHNLINREGYQAGITVGASKINKYLSVHASRPWSHPLDDVLAGTLTYEEELINQGEGNLDLSTNTLKAGIARNIRQDSMTYNDLRDDYDFTNGWNQTYSLRYRLDELESGVVVEDRSELPVPFNQENAKPEQQALLFGYAVDKTISDNVANPTRGYTQYYSIEAGAEGVATDTNMAIVKAGVKGIYSFGTANRHQIVASLDGGYIWADDFENVPYKLRFFAGGDRSLRGYDYESLSTLENGYLIGGEVLAIGSGEYNYAFTPSLRGAVFADVGNAYDTEFTTDTKLGVGFGVRWASPVGMVRLDLAAGVLEDSIPVRLHFFIGSPLQ